MHYDPAQFERLTDERWDPARVEDAIATIVADADTAFDSEALWPAHEWDGWEEPLPLKSLYLGAAGVIWALDALANWPGSPRSQLARPREGRTCVQWCTGAPGVLAGAWEYLDEDLRAANGRGRYSLWTGDVGTALFAAACLDLNARYPILDMV